MDELTKIRNYSQVRITELRDADWYGLVRNGVYPIRVLQLVIKEMKRLGLDLPRYEKHIPDTSLDHYVVATLERKRRLNIQGGGCYMNPTYEVFKDRDDAMEYYSKVRHYEHVGEACMAKAVVSNIDLSEVQ
jgi:hypothetical protein